MSNITFVHFPDPFEDGPRRLCWPTEPHQTEAGNALKICDALMPTLHLRTNASVWRKGSDSRYAKTNESTVTAPAVINQGGALLVRESSLSVSLYNTAFRLVHSNNQKVWLWNTDLKWLHTYSCSCNARKSHHFLCEYIVFKFVKQTSDLIKGAIAVECLQC